jgi:hypothetical protein
MPNGWLLGSDRSGIFGGLRGSTHPARWAPLQGGDFSEDGLNGFGGDLFRLCVGNLDVSGEEK